MNLFGECPAYFGLVSQRTDDRVVSIDVDEVNFMVVGQHDQDATLVDRSQL